MVIKKSALHFCGELIFIPQLVANVLLAYEKGWK